MDLFVDGVAVQTYAWNVTDRASRWSVAGRRGSNQAMPGVHGTLWTAGKPFDEKTLVWNMWAVGSNPDGSMPTNKSRQRQCLDNLDALTRLFGRPGLLDVKQRIGASFRQFSGEVVNAIDFSSMAGGTRAEFAVEWLLPVPFWRDIGWTTQTLYPGNAFGVLLFSSFETATAPLVRAKFEVTGPAQSPMLTDSTTQQWVKLNESLAAGQVWKIDSATWSSTVNGVNKIGVTTHGGGATFLDPTPRPDGGPLVLFQAAGGVTAATSVKMSAQKTYHLA